MPLHVAAAPALPGDDMTSATRFSRPFYVGDPSAERGSLPWVTWVFGEAKGALNDASKTQEYVQASVSALLKDNHFRLLTNPAGQHFFMWEVFAKTPQPHGLGYSPEAIDAIIAGRKSITAQEHAAQAQPIAAPGGDRKSEAARENQGSVTTLIGGRDAAYLTARIARDHPDILEAMKAGKYSSTRQAAIAAGIIKKTVTVSLEPQRLGASLLRNMPPEDVATLIAVLQAGCEPPAVTP